MPECGPGERPVCQDCHGAVDKIGPRGAWREVKAMNAERTREWGRFVLDNGPSIEVGGRTRPSSMRARARPPGGRSPTTGSRCGRTR